MINIYARFLILLIKGSLTKLGLMCGGMTAVPRVGTREALKDVVKGRKGFDLLDLDP
jgi:hypothetical protein